MTASGQFIVAIALFFFGFAAGFTIENWRAQAHELQTVNKAVAVSQAASARSAAQAAKLNADNAARAAQNRVSDTKRSKDIAKNPSITNCKLSSAVLRDFNDMLKGTAAR